MTPHLHVVDVNDDRTWPSHHDWWQVISPGGWQVSACRFRGPFMVRDGRSTTTVHDGVLVLNQLRMFGVPWDTFKASYENYPKEWK